MKITRTNDSDLADVVIESTLRLISEQPSDWVIRVTYYHVPGTGEERVVEGTVAAFDGSRLVMADMDQECQHTGGSTETDVPTITEIEVL